MNILTNTCSTQWHVPFGKSLLIIFFSLKVRQNFSYVLILKQIIQIIFYVLSAILMKMRILTFSEVNIVIF